MNQKKVGIVLTYINLAINFLVGLVYTPFMLNVLGKNEYGIYQLVYSIVANLSLLSFGFDSSYIRFYTRCKARDDEDDLKKLNGLYIIIFLIMSTICLVCGTIMVGQYKIVLGGKLAADELYIAKRLMILLVLNLALMFPNSLLDCYISANEKFLFQRVVSIAYSLLNPLVAIPFLWMGFGSVGIVTTVTVLSIVKLIINFYYAFLKLNMRFCFRKLDFSILKEMSGFTFFIFINQIIDMINWNLDKYILGRMSGSVSVAVYSVGAEIHNIYMQLSTAVSRVFVPQVNRLSNEEDSQTKLIILMTKVGRLQYQILFLILLGFIFWGKQFILLWVGNGYEESYYIVLLLIGSATIPFFQNIGVEIQRAYNMHRTRTIVYALIAGINIFLTVLFIPHFGVCGAALGTAVAVVMGNVLFMNWYYQSRMHLDMKYFWKHILGFIPHTIVVTLFGAFLRSFIKVDTWITLIISVVIFTFAYIVTLWFLGLNVEEKMEIRKTRK